MWFKMFASCIVVKGKAYSLIYDLERSAFYEIPNDVAEILEMAKNHNIENLKQFMADYDSDLIQNLLEQFIENELAFLTEQPESFPDIDFTWESPHPIVNAIIEIAAPACYDIHDIVSQLSDLACKAVQVRILQPLTHEALADIVVQAFKNVRIQYIELLIPYDGGIDEKSLISLATAQPRLRRIMVYAAPEEKILETTPEKFGNFIFLFKKDLRINKDEVIEPKRFATNMLTFPEALQYNLGLNRKVCIDREGYIRNYIDHQLSFGNIKTHRLKEIITLKEFQEKWVLSNDKLEICKDCQYRYTCVSNSDIIQKNGNYYKLHMCGFDPGKNQWA